MPIVKNQYPILEYDTALQAVIQPNRNGNAKLPERCVITFFGEVLNEYIAKTNAKIISTYKSEMRDFPVYKIQCMGYELCLVQAAVGSGSIAMMTDFLIGYGVKYIIACGGCGVLKNIPAGDVIIPTSALRDEGASYKYIPPSREIKLNDEAIKVIEKTLRNHGIQFIECKTWTTDGFYRETPDMILYRKEEGCCVVEMECSTMAAIAQFRNVKFGQLLYSGDILDDFDNYNERDWSKNLTAREKLFLLSLESVCEFK